MTRYVIIGAGAVGASLAAQFELAGIPYALVGRGAQISHIREHGLSYRRPTGTQQVKLNAFDLSDPPELTPQDILLLTVKSQDASSALAFWSWRSVSGAADPAAVILPIVTFQNGLATEALALRTFAHVHGASIMTPARFTETGNVVCGGDPEVGVVTIGRFPRGRDETSNRIATDLKRAGYLAETTGEITGWKAAKLLHNARNVLELFHGPADLRSEIGESLVDEARRALQAAGFRLAAPSERNLDISNWRVAQSSGIHPGQQSTWQSFTRGASSEVDFLNGEIVLLGRVHGVATPYNDAVQRIAGRLAQHGGFSDPLPLEDILSLVGSGDQRHGLELAVAR
jgi:2-dehydropantoate 2-reductase